jgi:hypothetical protein
VEDNIYRWLTNGSVEKPGNKMGKIDITEDQARGLAQYLAGLKIEAVEMASGDE